MKVKKISSAEEYHLYRITFRRIPQEGDTKVTTRTFITFGVDESDAVQRVADVFKGSSFGKEFDLDAAVVEFMIGGVMKVGGN